MADLPGKGKTVCVTGASGFIGSHIVKLLLERGYTVRGTVRDSNNEEKYGWLYDLADGTPGTLELYSADLSVPESFDTALNWCELVIHVAASVVVKAADPQKEIVDVTVEGTRNVLETVLKHKKAKRVVMTSSVAANFSDLDNPHYMHTEKDWYTEMMPGLSYNVAKTLSERLAWKMYEEQKKKKEEGIDGETWNFELTTVNPAYVLGKLLNNSHVNGSMLLIKGMLDGRDMFIPDFNFSIVNVKDVALAHVLCLEKETAEGRFIVSQDKADLSVLEIAGVVHKEYPAAPVPTSIMPTWLLYWLVYFSPLLTKETIDFMANRRWLFSPQKAKDVLGLQITPAAETIIEGAQSLIDLKIVPDPRAPPRSMFSFMTFGTVAPAPPVEKETDKIDD